MLPAFGQVVTIMPGMDASLNVVAEQSERLRARSATQMLTVGGVRPRNRLIHGRKGRVPRRGPRVRARMSRKNHGIAGQATPGANDTGQNTAPRGRRASMARDPWPRRSRRRRGARGCLPGARQCRRGRPAGARRPLRRPVAPGQYQVPPRASDACWSRRAGYKLTRPANACASVPPSTYSSSPPRGTPCASRVTLTRQPSARVVM